MSQNKNVLLTLEPLCKHDLGLWLELYTDSETMQHIGPPLKREKATNLFNHAILKQSKTFVIRHTRSKKKLGLIGLKKQKGMVAVYELGVMIRKRYSNKGYAYKATKLMLNMAFEQLAVEAINTFCNLNNQGANRISQALGFVNKGIQSTPGFPTQENQWQMTAEHFDKLK